MFYGIETTEDWLSNYANSILQAHNRPTIPRNSVVDLAAAVKLLQYRLRTKNLRLQTAFTIDTPIPRHVPGTPRTFPLPPCGRPIVAICSSGHRSFQRRPSQAQVDPLQQIMGGEAKWWLSDD